MGLINQTHLHDPEKDTFEVCEWIDAGIFSGDLLYTTNVELFKKYLGRWTRAVEAHQETLNDTV